MVQIRQGNENIIQQLYKEINLKNAVYMTEEAWAFYQ